MPAATENIIIVPFSNGEIIAFLHDTGNIIWSENVSKISSLSNFDIKDIKDKNLKFSWDKDLGSIEKGKLADMVVLDKNPLKVEPLKIKDIKVMQTIKEGKTIFLRDE